MAANARSLIKTARRSARSACARLPSTGRLRSQAFGGLASPDGATVRDRGPPYPTANHAEGIVVSLALNSSRPTLGRPHRRHPIRFNVAGRTRRCRRATTFSQLVQTIS